MKIECEIHSLKIWGTINCLVTPNRQKMNQIRCFHSVPWNAPDTSVKVSHGLLDSPPSLSSTIFICLIWGMYMFDPFCFSASILSFYQHPQFPFGELLPPYCVQPQDVLSTSQRLLAPFTCTSHHPDTAKHVTKA